MDKATEKALSFLAEIVLDSEWKLMTLKKVNMLTEMVDGNFSAFVEKNMTAWEPIPEQKEGRCGTCRHLDRSTCFTTYPPKYACSKTGELHFESDICDVSAFCVGGED